MLISCAPGTAAADGFLADSIAAGSDSDACERAWLESQFEELSARIAPQSLRHLPVKERLCALHARLHAEILVGEYRKEASDLTLAISRGDYNCLSATAMYWDLAREAGWELEIWSLPGHVFLRCPQQDVTINPAAQDWTAAIAAARDVSSATVARKLTPQQLVGKFYYNRGLLALERRDYVEGIQCLRQSLALDPQDKEARVNLLAGLNNWAVELCRQERYASAHALLCQGLAINPDFAPLVSNERSVREKLTP